MVYVLMPDHVHMILHGSDEESDLLAAHDEWKSNSGRMLCRHLNRDKVWQHKSHDPVLRSNEYERGALRKTVGYILENPVRAGLVSKWQEFPFLGSLIGPCDIRFDAWWDWFYG